MRTSELFGAKNFGFFKYMMCPHRQGEGGLSQCGQGERVQFFAIICGRL